ncbi:glycoside hydrolase family 9 protein [Runella sp. MFBS21]|uniref:glycoside hydrolase family 9 protein n=1 Tax=Runella sp. MFBS21 TaxID=3034018 RepID=UPI0023F6E213|nr:glycoside hydrolase family 9 protein [Runella sp. MFBS21]MDF7819649.1 glycoside hydrolase family 9 protein [Runella sp. MFBS21]
MKPILFFRAVILLFCISTYLNAQQSWIRINQLGYLPQSTKVAVWVNKEEVKVADFELCDALTDRVVLKSKAVKPFGAYAAFKSSYRLNFSNFTKPGGYYLKAAGVRSPIFRIGADVYDGTADFVLKYMRQQRSGYNPFLKDSCHRQDGYVIYYPDSTQNGKFMDASGGWHDASDYLQYVTTSANATYQLLFAYQQNPEAFGDSHDAAGHPTPNGIPDILDEAKWGLDWLVKMNPAKDVMFNQIADDRDHAGMRLPTKDSVVYNRQWGLGRPVYMVTGQPQGLFKYKNRTTGVASTAGKYASAFALGSQLLSKYYPDFSKKILQKALDAYDFGKRFPGVCQTAPGRAPYFYEEDNYVDDMELAAAQLYQLNSSTPTYLNDAVNFGKAEPTTPWMGADTAKHYQWYPFVNLGHYLLSKNNPTFRQFMKDGIEKVKTRGQNNPFLNGIPFIWCSNNLTVGILTQLHLYRSLTKDRQYEELEAAMRDWLFGCNPWGTSMICGLPEGGDWPTDPHSSFTHLYQYRIDGGLVDGPIYGSIFGKLIGITLYKPDEYADFQSKLVVYHDDYGDYSTNEPTMDGTASLSYILSAYQKEGKSLQAKHKKEQTGAIIQMDTTQKRVFLTFTGHEFAEGTTTILKTLKEQNIKASFFLTGDFLRNPAYQSYVEQMHREGHYVGMHSDKHLLYCDWNKRDSLLISQEQFEKDIQANAAELSRVGIEPAKASIFMPPYEWYNASINDWARNMGLTLVNFTPKIGTNADYTWPELPNYRSSEQLLKRFWEYEPSSPNHLNGAIVLIHLGTDPRRKDKFYDKLPQILQQLKAKGYQFGRF